MIIVPQKDMNYVYGVPNQTNILETRYIPGKELKKIERNFSVMKYKIVYFQHTL